MDSRNQRLNAGVFELKIWNTYCKFNMNVESTSYRYLCISIEHNLHIEYVPCNRHQKCQVECFLIFVKKGEREHLNLTQHVN